ncbi:MAG: helix-turn-helix domain-containing protein [Caldiserica bacterium]|jgi:Zn-dependent peptidase ImmA (M78 family)|nr:helix-turn-helix domain-containing protein [Caldisericota bacterium]MDH7562525.1 helix-turn-helix domain-containing protein [Caldisericota bacterium]
MIGERIKVARRRSGLNLRQLAEQVGVSAQAISKYERGLDVPSSAVLIKLAHALGVRIEYLLRPVTVSLSQLNYRSHASKLRAKDKKIVQAKVQDWLERYLLIEELVSSQEEFKFPDIMRRIKCLEDVEQVAVELRRNWKLGIDPIDYLAEILEAQGIKVGMVEGVSDFDSLMLWANERIPVIVVKADIPGDRQRFNMAHELGHLILELPSRWSKQLIEKAAFRFAGAFLAPEPSVRKELGDHRQRLDLYELQLLKQKYGMSMQAWIYRAKDLGILPETQAQAMFKEFRAKGWYRKEPGDPYPPEKLDRLERLVRRALAEELISNARAAEILGVSTSQLWMQASWQNEHISPQANC